MNLEDCYYYYYSSCTKAERCPYRHSEAALGSEQQCPDWSTGTCYSIQCPYRHMTIEKKRSDIACYWESQAGGCRKPHCVFQHTRPRDQSGTILSEEEKLNAVTSPPPQIAMPMADGPPIDIFYDPLPQDNATRSVDSPAVEKVIINPFEEETDEESLHGTPVKTGISQRIQELQVAKNPFRKEKTIAKESDDLNFTVKSLEQIRREKLERAKKIAEEADQLLRKKENSSKEIQEIKEETSRENMDKIVEEKKPNDTNKIKINPKTASSDDIPAIKSYEEILRERAIASMIEGRKKKEAERREQDKKAQEESKRTEPSSRYEDTRSNLTDRNYEDNPQATKPGIGRRVVVKRKSKSPPSSSRSETRQSIHTRIGGRVQDRITLKRVNNTDQDVNVDRIKASNKLQSVKSRLGFTKENVLKEKSPAVQQQQQKRSVKERLGMNSKPVRARSPSPDIKKSDTDRITMSDFSSDGMSNDESSDDEEALKEKQRILMEKLAAIEKKKKSKKNVVAASTTRKTVNKQESDHEDMEQQERSESEEEEVEQEQESFASDTEEMETVKRGTLNVRKVENSVKEKTQIAEQEEEESYHSDKSTESESEVVKVKKQAPKRNVEGRATKRKIVIENINYRPSSPKLKAVTKTKKVEKKKAASKASKRQVPVREEVSEEYSEEEEHFRESEEHFELGGGGSQSEEFTESEEEQETEGEYLTEEEIESPPQVKRQKIIKKTGKTKVPVSVKSLSKKNLKSVKKEPRASRMQLYRPPPMKLKTEEIKPVKVLTVKDRLGKRRVERHSSEDDGIDLAPLKQTVTIKQVVEKPKKSKQRLVKSYSEMLLEKQSRTAPLKKRSVSPVQDWDEPKESKRPKVIFSPITADKFPVVTVTGKKRNVLPGSFEDELDQYKATQHKTKSMLSRSDNQAAKSSVKVRNIWSSRSKNRENGSETLQISGARKLSIHKRLGAAGNKNVKDKYETSRKQERNVSEDVFDISTPQPVKVDKKIPPFSKKEKSKSSTSSIRNPLRISIDKENSSAAKKSPKLLSPKAKQVPMKSTLEKRSSDDASSSTKTSTKAAGFGADVAAIIEPNLNPSPVADNELNLDDTDQLERELLELLGGGDSLKSSSQATSGNNNLTNTEEDLLLEDFLS